jgi:hypothetical protein
MQIDVRLRFYKHWFSNPNDYEWFCAKEPPYRPGAPVCAFFRDALNSQEYHAWSRRLAEAGLKPLPESNLEEDDEPTNPRYIGYYIRCVRYSYTPKECEQSEYVRFFLEADMQEGCAEAPAGEALIDMDNVTNEVEEDTARAFRSGRLRFFRLAYNYLAVSDEGKRLLEASGLTGFQLTRPLKVNGDEADKVKGRYWHLDLTSTLPLSPKMRWVADDGSTYIGPWKPGAAKPEDGLIALDRVGVEQAGTPDLAIQARYLPDAPPHITTVGSRRWFQFCKANKIKCHWTPLDVLA